MNYVKRIVCLANSRKHSGRCIAGKEVLAHGYGTWIRPVSARPSAEVSEEERRYENGRDPQVLDIIDVPMIGAAPLLHQTENHVIDAGYCWTKSGELPWAELKHLVDKPVRVWPNGDSTYSGLNDRVKLELASELVSSLMLIAPETLTVHVRIEGAEFGNPRRRVRAYFKQQGTKYILVVTDPAAERAFLAKPDGDYPLKDVYLCVSLGEAHTDGCCYKLVAAIISEQPL
jgi:hypothetical protein